VLEHGWYTLDLSEGMRPGIPLNELLIEVAAMELVEDELRRDAMA